MKKMCIVLLTALAALSISACSGQAAQAPTSSETTAAGGYRNDYGKIVSVSPDAIRVTLVPPPAGENVVCDLPANGVVEIDGSDPGVGTAVSPDPSGSTGTAKPGVGGPDSAGNGNAQVAQPLPEGAIPETEFAISNRTKILDESGKAAGLDSLKQGCIVRIVLDGLSGETTELVILQPA
jgi:ABC-type Fe3+-hydroxamate transport system substrate-binding protein